MKKKLTAFLLLLSMVWTLSGCGTASSTKKPIEKEETGSSQQGEQEKTGTDKKTENQDKTSKTSLPTIESQVLLEQEGLSVTAQELTQDPIWGTGLKLLVENNSEQNCSLRCDSLVINGYMMNSSFFSVDVSAGKKANETLFFAQSDLEGAGIDTVMDITARFTAYDPDSYEDRFGPVEVSLSTSAAGSVQQPDMDEGKELYSQNGVRIVGNYVEEDTFWGAGVVLFLENQGEEDVVVSCDDLSVNGFMVTPYFSCQVNKGCRAVSSITMMAEDLEKNGISQVEDIQLTFRGYSPESYDTLFETGPIDFSVGE